MQIPETKLIKYLLGSLDESGERAISLRLIEDKSLENELLYAESELIEAFLENSLSPEDARLFQTNFLINERRENQLKEIYLLKKYAAHKFQQKKTAEIQRESSPGLLAALKNLFSAKLKPIPVILTAVIIVLALGAAWRVFFTNSAAPATQLEKQYAEINRGDLKDSPELTVAPIVLIPGALRGSGDNAKVESAKIGDNVFFRLGLPFEINGREFLKTELTKDRKTIFTQAEVRIYKNENGQEVKLILPKSVLEKGQYQIRLENPDNENSPVNYTFVVE